MNKPQTEAGRALLDDPDEGYPVAPPEYADPKWREELAQRIAAIEAEAVLKGRAAGILETANEALAYAHAEVAANPRYLDLISPEAEQRLAAMLHREDLTGRAIHEDAYAMQVPSFGANECHACLGHANRLTAALREDAK